MQNIDLLNVEQKALFDAVVDRVENPQESNVFFVDGPGGSGKTFATIPYWPTIGREIKFAYRSLQVRSPHAYYTRVKRRIQRLEFH